MTDYSKYEYADKLAEMTELLKEADGWGDGYQSSMGQTLIQLMADVTDTLHYMLERRTEESFLHTARLRSSIVARASELGYRVRRIVSNGGWLKVTITDHRGDPVTAIDDTIIPRYSMFEYDGIKHYTTNQTSIRNGENSTLVYVKQGEMVEISREIDSNETITIEDWSGIDEQLFEVSCRGSTYLDVLMDEPDVNRRALSFLGPTEEFYDLRFSNDGMRIIFGNDKNGKKPDGLVDIRYLKVDPDNDQILTIGLPFEYDGTLSDSSGVEYKLQTENATPINGYKEEETNDEIKENAVIYHRSSGRATTNQDYEFWVSRSGIGSIVDVRAYGEDEMVEIFYYLNNVFISYLKADGSKLTFEEEQELRKYINRVKTSQAHVVFKPAKRLGLQVKIDAKKNLSNPVTNAEIYDRLNRYITQRLGLSKGAIGRTVYASDLVHEIHQLRNTVNDITYPLVEYVSVDVNGVMEFSNPGVGDKAFVGISESYVPTDGDVWVLIVNNIVCEIPIYTSDELDDILWRMRDKVLEVTPFPTKIVATDIALDAVGRPIPIEIDTQIGETMLIGMETPYYRPTQLVDGAVIGTTLSRVSVNAGEATVHHFYYSSPKGRRPMIPLRLGTEVNFTAPTDTEVKVYEMDDKYDSESERMIKTLSPGETYNYMSTEEHILQFEYVDDSSEDEIVEIIYQDYFALGKYGLQIRPHEAFPDLKIRKTSGDLSDHVQVSYVYQLPLFNKNLTDATEPNILPNSLTVCDPDGFVRYRDNGAGGWQTALGSKVETGGVDYVTGEVMAPLSLAEGNYIFIFDQNTFNNFTADEMTAAVIIPPKPSLNSPEQSLSTINVEY